MTVEITRLGADNHRVWHRLIEKSPQSELYHTSEWLRIAQNYTDTELILLVASKSEEIIGGIPLFLDAKYGGLYRRLMSPPYPSITQISNLGPVLADYEGLKQNKKESRQIAFLSSLDDYVRTEIGPDFVQVITTPNLMDIRPYQWSGYEVVPNYTYIADIERKEVAWRGLDTEVRRQINNASKMGVEIEEAGLDEYRYICTRYVEHHERQGLTLEVPWHYLSDIFHEFYPDNLRIFIAKYRGKKIAGQINLLYKDKVTFWLGGVRSKIAGIYPNRLLTWKVIEWAADNGYKSYEDIGGNTPSISAFKSKFGFSLKLYFTITRSSLRYRIFRKLAGS